MKLPRANQTTMPLGEHLEELRRRLLLAIYGLLPIAVVAFYFGDRILEFLLRPAQRALQLGGQAPTLIITGPLELFGAYVRISFIAALLVGSPWVLYQLWLFVAPGLYKRERRFVYLLLPLSTFLTIVGVAFFYGVILPIMLRFFIGFAAGIASSAPAAAPLPEGVTLSHVTVLPADPPSPAVGDSWINTNLNQWRTVVAMDGTVPRVLSVPLMKETGVSQQYRVAETLKLVLTMSLAFAASFQTPVVVLLLGWAGIIDVAALKHYRKHALLICAIAAAFITPTADPLNLALLMIPLYMLYELGAILLRVFPASRVTARTVDQEDEAEG